MTPSRLSLNFAKLFLPLFLILSTSYYLFHFPGRLSIINYNPFSDDPTSIPVSREEFIRQELKNEIDGPYDGEPLAALCGTRNYQPGLIVKCLAAPGGMGNVRNMMLNCIRFALEGGATGLIVPEIMLRGNDSLSNLFTENNCEFTYMFDLDHFVASFKKACPKVHLYLRQSDLPRLASLENATICEAHTLSNSHHPVATTLIDHPEDWRSSFNTWLNDKVPPFSAAEPALVAIPMQLLRFPFSYDEPAFVATFGRLLKFREDIRILAATVLFSMSKKYHLNLDVSKPDIQEGKFYGAHLRTATDAAAVGWPGYDMQAPNYLNSTMSHSLQLIYLSSGNSADAARFTEAASALSINVTTKDLLLSEPGFESAKVQMENVSWDQKGIIDYLVLLRSSYFGGMYESSFSWNLANRRHVVVGNGNWTPITRETQGVPQDGSRAECFIDELSAIFGPLDMMGLRWQFPWGLYP